MLVGNGGKASTQERQIATPGILGGLGPLAHIELEKRILQQRHQQIEISCDQDYPTWLMVSATQIPDRTASLESREERDRCIEALRHYAQRLQTMGSDFIIIPCNTAHIFYREVQAAIDIPWLHLMDATADFIRQRYPEAKTVGVLATDGTIKAGLYAKSLQQVGLIAIEPTCQSLTQKQVMKSIYTPKWGIKTTGTQVSDRAMRSLSEAAISLYAQGAELVIAGCTELSIACPHLNNLPIPWVDPLQVIAQSVIAYAYGAYHLPSIHPSHTDATLSYATF